MSRCRRGFTLVEVLVAIAVVAGLLGLLLPTLSGVVKTSRATVSQSNLRQWGVGTLGFTAVHRETLPWEGFKGAAEMHQYESESLGLDAHPALRLASIGDPAATILMLEMRTVERELPPDDPYYHFGLIRARADWKRLAARHNGGGHLLKADGHVHHVDFKYATTNDAGTRNPDEPDADWNKPGLIWNPRNRAVEGPGN